MSRWGGKKPGGSLSKFRSMAIFWAIFAAWIAAAACSCVIPMPVENESDQFCPRLKVCFLPKVFSVMNCK